MKALVSDRWGLFSWGGRYRRAGDLIAVAHRRYKHRAYCVGSSVPCLRGRWDWQSICPKARWEWCPRSRDAAPLQEVEARRQPATHMDLRQVPRRGPYGWGIWIDKPTRRLISTHAPHQPVGLLLRVRRIHSTGARTQQEVTRYEFCEPHVAVPFLQRRRSP